MWVDLFQYLVDNGYGIYLCGGTNDFPDEETVQPLGSPGIDQEMLLIDGSIYALYQRPGAYDFGNGSIQLGGVLTIQYINGQWQPTASAFQAYDSVGELLANQQIRVRCILGSNSEGGSEEIVGLGSAAFIFYDDIVGEYIKGVEFAQFHEQSAWTEQPGPGVASNWFAYTISPDDFAEPSEAVAFFGIGTMGGNPDAGGPTSEYALFEWQIWVDDGPEPPAVSYNCECDDASGNKTLKQLRDDLLRRLGFAAQVNNPPPGMAPLLDSFLQDAQESLYRRYDVLRTERFFSWPLEQGVRMYDLPENEEECTKRLDPRKVTWVGVERDGQWSPLRCGIPPELYSHNITGRPERYEIRQCIEIWPEPDETDGRLRIKGRFGLEPFTADSDTTSIDSHAVFLLALANAKAHYGKPDARNYIAQLETYMLDMVAGAHHTRRYIPGRDHREDMIYVAPKPLVPFP